MHAVAFMWFLMADRRDGISIQRLAPMAGTMTMYEASRYDSRQL